MGELFLFYLPFNVSAHVHFSCYHFARTDLVVETVCFIFPKRLLISLTSFTGDFNKRKDMLKTQNTLINCKQATKSHNLFCS